MMFVYIYYADVLTLYRAGQIDEIRDGMLGPFGPSQSILLAASLVVIIPASMIFLALTLTSRTTRWTNIAAGAAFALVNISNVVGETWANYRVFGILKILVTPLILRYPWKAAEVTPNRVFSGAVAHSVHWRHELLPRGSPTIAPAPLTHWT